MAEKTGNEQYLDKCMLAANDAIDAHTKGRELSEDLHPITQMAELIADLGHLCDDSGAGERGFELIVAHGVAKWRAERKVFRGRDFWED
jgi:hypothetical protein